MLTGSVGYTWIGCGGYLLVEGKLYFEQTQINRYANDAPLAGRVDAGKYDGVVTEGW